MNDKNNDVEQTKLTAEEINQLEENGDYEKLGNYYFESEPHLKSYFRALLYYLKFENAHKESMTKELYKRIAKCYAAMGDDAYRWTYTALAEEN